jgi:hypothetical protein
MPNAIVTEPPTAGEAFQRTDEAAALTQAAVLLALGLKLQGLKHLLPSEDVASLGLPDIPPLGGKIDSEARRIRLESRFGTSVASPIPAGEDVTWQPNIFSDLALDHIRKPTSLSAVDLMEACVRHPHEIVRVAAAAAYHDWSSEPDKLDLILLQGTRSADLLTRQLAATALAQVSPSNARLTDFQQASRRTAGASGGHTSMLVHGTWAFGAKWWQPGGDFHSYLLYAVRSDLYRANDRFAWSGGYSLNARELGAEDLLKWVTSHKEQGLDLFAHSHGGNVAMLASNKGLSIGKLILLSCPVHFSQYQPDFNRIQMVASIRVRMDLVILADRGGQRFADPRIKENVLPIWFDHTATHNPSIWKDNTYQILRMV